METADFRAGYMCNYEVLSIMRAQHEERQAQIKALGERRPKRATKAQRDQDDEEAERIQPQELHTVTFEGVKYLEQDVLPMRRQTESAVTKLLNRLVDAELTKAERLQIVNLAPQSLVELVVCVDDFEERFPDAKARERLLEIIKGHLGDEQTSAVTADQLRAPSKSKKSDGADEEDVDDAEHDEVHDMEDLIDEGTGQGALEDAGRDIDEQDA